MSICVHVKCGDEWIKCVVYGAHIAHIEDLGKYRMIHLDGNSLCVQESMLTIEHLLGANWRWDDGV